MQVRPHRFTARVWPAALVLVALFAASRLDAVGALLGWEQRGSFAGAEFTSMVTPPGYPGIIAITAKQPGGLAVSTDYAQSFASLFPLDSYGVTARDSQTGYVAAGLQGVVMTTDGGSNWHAVATGLPASPDSRAVVLHVGSPDSVFAGLYNGGVFVGGQAPSQPDSVTWTGLNAGLLDLRVRTLARVRGGTFLIAATDGGLWRRAGGVWALVGPGLVANRIVIDSADSSRVYAATETGVWKSTNQGITFSPSSTGLPSGVAVNDIARRTDAAHVLYVGTRGQGVYESIDHGTSWHAFGPALPGDNDVRAVLCAVGTAGSPDTASVYAGTRAHGLFLARYSTPAQPTSWGRFKDRYRR